VERKKQVALQVQAGQWKGWSLLVRHYRAIQRDSRAQALLFEMQDRFRRIRGDRNPDLFWTAATALVQLYAEGSQPERVHDTLKQMEKFIGPKDGERSAQLGKMKLKYASR
jgi:hypothetical protein